MDLLKRARAAAREGQAAIELAVFGAVLIFILGMIVRSAVSGSYVQNQTLKGMRKAMLKSWNSSQADNSGNPVTGVSRNSASVLFVEDRLSPDVTKYGPLERSPEIASGSGTFSYLLQYPLDLGEVGGSNLPIMDVYINGQHFPLTTASFVPDRLITRRTTACDKDGIGGGPYPVPYTQTDGGPTIQQQCLQNQCLRDQREWVGGTVQLSDFNGVVKTSSTCPSDIASACCPEPASPPPPPPPPPFDYSICSTVGLCSPDDNSLACLCTTDQSQCSAYDIINALANSNDGSIITATTPPTYIVNYTTLSQRFKDDFTKNIAPKYDDFTDWGAQLNEIQRILQSHETQYKLFYSQAANSTSEFHVNPPTCSLHPCQDRELSKDLTLGGVSNANGDLMFDLQRNNDQTQIEAQFPVGGGMRHDVAWQWSATAGIPAAGGTGGGGVVVDPQNYNYPSYDIDGRLKTVTIYNISGPGTSPTVTYEDPDGGDIDPRWDANSCDPRPGLINNAQIFTFTSPNAGAAPTYLEIKEGQLYNPETGQRVVRSVNKRYTVDLIQRMIQLSNNTHRFCDGANNPLSTVANDGVTPNPVERCGDCFDPNDPDSIKQTCFDTSTKILYVRSRLKNTGGRFWITNTSGQLGVQ